MSYVGDLCRGCGAPIGEELAHKHNGYWYHEECLPAPAQGAEEFFDDCEVYFELNLGGKLEDAVEFLEGFDTEVRLAAIAMMKAYAAHVTVHKDRELAQLHEWRDDAEATIRELQSEIGRLRQALDSGMLDYWLRDYVQFRPTWNDEITKFLSALASGKEKSCQNT